MLTLFLQLTVVILFSALFSGMEIAFVSSNRLLLGIDQSNRSLTSFVIDKYYSNSNNFISSLLVGNNIVLVIYGMLMAQLLNMTILKGLEGATSLNLLLETLISTIVIIFTGEFIPKALFRINPNRSLKRFALITYPIYILLYPLSRFTSICSTLLLRLTGIKIKDETRDTTFSKTELNNLILSSIESAGDEETIAGGDRDFCVRAVAEGFAALAIEQRAFGQCGGTEQGPACIRPAMEALLMGRTLIGERVWDVMRVVDAIEAHFGDLITMEDNMVLVETSTWNPPPDMSGTLRRIQKAGYRPLLAHPERYRYLNGPGFERIHKMGVHFQVNLASLVGYYGETAMKKAHLLLEHGWYSEVGTDCHRVLSLSEQLSRTVLTKEVLELIKKIS